MLYSLRKFSKSEVAQERLRIIRFYEEYGEKATQDAFGSARRVISRWRKRLRDNGGVLRALVPLSTRPRRVRRSRVPPEIIDFIRGFQRRTGLSYFPRKILSPEKRSTAKIRSFCLYPAKTA